MTKIIKYIISVLAVALVIYFSLDIQQLDEHKAQNSDIQFDAVEFAQDFWDNELMEYVKAAPNLELVTRQLDLDPELAFQKYGHKLGISKTYYLMLKGAGTITSVEDEFIRVKINDDLQIQLATDFIFGNAVRDGSGKVDINQFVNMTDFNNVSVALNKLVKEKVVAPLVKSAKVGMKVEFGGATEINEDEIDLSTIRVFPISIKLSDG